MPFFSPLRLFVIPFVFLVALPLAICASITTIIAFLVLFLRLFLVYFDLGLETLSYVLVGHAAQARYVTSRSTSSITPTSSTSLTPAGSPATATFRHRRPLKRQTSAGSGTTTQITGLGGLSGLPPSSAGLDRDFEGVGGWRLDGDNPAADERQWLNLNSRLGVPKPRHHFRSQSGDPVIRGSRSVGTSYSPVKLKMTQSPSRPGSRTPNMVRVQGLTGSTQDGYFRFV
ncbi:hypothetical protein GGS20DRAFT_416248 [Poronia punctata]|nr:hypothetical protein GGS20DRAFT_416248 [Poronia punctata]